MSALVQEKRLSSESPTLREEHSPEKVVQQENHDVKDDKEHEEDQEDVLIVDWDGPDDPENPKK